MRIPPHERGDEPPADARKTAQRPRAVDSPPPHADTSRPSRSLMDDTEFLSELEHMEQHIDGESSAVPFHATFDRLDDGLGYGRSETDHGTRRHWRDDEASNTLDDADAPAAASDSRRNTLLAILGFALMMAIGAAAAAFLFRDRLALLLR